MLEEVQPQLRMLEEHRETTTEGHAPKIERRGGLRQERDESTLGEDGNALEFSDPDLIPRWRLRPQVRREVSNDHAAARAGEVVDDQRPAGSETREVIAQSRCGSDRDHASGSDSTMSMRLSPELRSRGVPGGPNLAVVVSQMNADRRRPRHRRDDQRDQEREADLPCHGRVELPPNERVALVDRGQDRANDQARDDGAAEDRAVRCRCDPRAPAADFYQDAPI